MRLNSPIRISRKKIPQDGGELDDDESETMGESTQDFKTTTGGFMRSQTFASAMLALFPFGGHLFGTVSLQSTSIYRSRMRLISAIRSTD